MKAKNVKPGVRVQHKKEGALGTVVFKWSDNIYVQYDGSKYYYISSPAKDLRKVKN